MHTFTHHNSHKKHYNNKKTISKIMYTINIKHTHTYTIQIYDNKRNIHNSQTLSLYS